MSRFSLKISHLIPQTLKALKVIGGFFTSIPHFIVFFFSWLFGYRQGFLYVYPQNKVRSFHFRLPSRLIRLFSGAFVLLFIGAFCLSVLNLILGYSQIKTMYENRDKKETMVAYQDLIQDYLIQYRQKEKRMDETVAILFDSKSKGSKAIGGSGNHFNPENLHANEKYSPVSPDEYFSKLQGQNFIEYVDQRLEKLGSTHSLIDRFEIRLDQQKRLSKNIPSSWPVRQLSQVNHEENDLSEESKKELEASLQKNSQGVSVEEGTLAIDSILSLVDDQSSSPKSLAIDISQPTAVVSTSRGIVDKVEKENGFWKVVVQHEYGFSTYYHGLDSVVVKPDDLVDRSAMLGTIGAVGTPKKKLKLRYQVKIANKFANPRDFLIFNY